MGLKTVKSELNEFAKEHCVAVVDSKGLRRGNLYDAKNIIREFSAMAEDYNMAGFSFDICESPETGVALYMIWASPDTMSYEQLLDMRRRLYSEIRSRYSN